MVHQNHPFSAGTQQMVTAQHTDYPLLLVQNGVAGVAVLQHGFPHIIHPVVQMEADQPTVVTDAADGGGLEQQAGGTVGVVGGGNDAGAGGQAAQLFAEFRLAEHQTVYIHFQGTADHVRLMAHQNNGVGAVKQQIIPALGQRNGHLTGNGVDVVTGIVEDLTLQNGKHIEQRDAVQLAGGDQAHVVVGDLIPGQHAIQSAVVVGDGDRGGGTMLMEHSPGAVHGDGRGKNRGLVKLQVPDLGVHTGNALGGLEPETVQNPLCLVGHTAQTGRFVFPVAQVVAQGCIGHGSHDGVGIRVSVAGNIDGIHRIPP